MRIGILGGGQLGRMLALAGYPLGMQFRVFDQHQDACAGQIAELVVGAFDDKEALERFAEGLDVVTYEFENVPVGAATFLAGKTIVHPNPNTLEIAQDRLREKELFRSLGLETPPFAACASMADLQDAAKLVGFPCLLKTRRLGYDGKGQALIEAPDDLESAWRSLGEAPCIAEGFVRFDRELSLLAARDRQGNVNFYPWIENEHRNGILRSSRSPVDPSEARVAGDMKARLAAMMHQLEYVGVLALELFEAGGMLLANEMAPRVHNSGHWTIDGAGTSQFENHLRAVSGMSLGASGARAHSGMVNVIGTIPALDDLLAIANARVHLYGKEPRPGRKVGHVNVVGCTAVERDDALESVRAIVGN